MKASMVSREPMMGMNDRNIATIGNTVAMARRPTKWAPQVVR